MCALAEVKWFILAIVVLLAGIALIGAVGCYNAG
jgi:preprotein translocase subunit Sss1